MLTTDHEGNTIVTLPAIEDRYRAAEGADVPGLYEGGGVPRIDARKVLKAAALAFLALCTAGSLLLSLANRLFP